MSTDIEWELLGKNNPYYGVITQEKFKNQNLTEEAKAEFFELGKGQVLHVLNVCRCHLDSSFTPKTILDFGCGAGRLIVPFAAIAEHVVGLDVSDSMLAEAAKNCANFELENVKLLKSDDDLSTLNESFDLIHSVIVFQHIPVDRGRKIFANLLNHLNDGGVGAIQITYSRTIFEKYLGAIHKEPLFKKLSLKTKKTARAIALKLHPNQKPKMQMNPYNLNEIFFILQSANIHNVYFEFTDHGGELGVFLYFQKPHKV